MGLQDVLGRWIHGIDYAYIVPFSAKLPLWLGQKVASLRGLITLVFSYDWRYVSVGSKLVRSRTFQSMKIIQPEAGKIRCAWHTVMRFQHNAREEWQSCLFRSSRMEAIRKKSTIEGFEEIRNLQLQGRGLVLLSCHLDSFCMGMVLLGMHGLKVNCVNTRAGVEDPRINPYVKNFLKNKYSNMERLMHGKMEYHETNMQFFYHALQNGEVVVLMGDIPGSKSSVHIPFLGRSFRMPLGAWHLARKTDSFIGGYVCINEGIGQYRVICLPPRRAGNSPESSLYPVYSFLMQWIRKTPERWVAADLLSDFPEYK